MGDGCIWALEERIVVQLNQVVLALHTPFKPGNQPTIDDHNHRQANIVHLISDQVMVMLVT
jgi:hypothetical protein